SITLRRALRAYGRRRARSIELLELEAAGLLHLLPGDVPDGLGERPIMTLEIGGQVRAVTVELVGRLHHDLRAGLAGAGAMLVYSTLEAHVQALRVLPAQRRGTAGAVQPLAADHDDTVAMGHLGMDDMALGVGQDLARLEAESLLQPLQRRAMILVGERRDEGRPGRDGHGRLLRRLSECAIVNHKRNYLVNGRSQGIPMRRGGNSLEPQ